MAKGRDLVKISAGISSVGIQVVKKEPSCTKEQIKWWQMSICFEHMISLVNEKVCKQPDYRKIWGKDKGWEI